MRKILRFEVHDFGQFKLHVYYTNDVMNDASFIVEGNSALVTLEQPLFRDNVQEYDAYVAQLNKPVEQRITNYHVGGTAQHDYVTPDGMAAFAKGPIYGGMMAGFQQAFGDTMTDLPTGKATEVAFGTTQTWAGVPLRVPPRGIDRLPCRQHPDRWENLLHALGSGTSSHESSASFLDSCHRCRNR